MIRTVSLTGRTLILAALIATPALGAEGPKPGAPVVKEVTMSYNDAYQLSQAIGNLSCAKFAAGPQGAMQCMEPTTWPIAAEARLALARDLRELGLAVADAQKVDGEIIQKYLDPKTKAVADDKRPQAIAEQVAVGNLQVVLSLQMIQSHAIAGDGVTGPSVAIIAALSPIFSDLDDLPAPRRAAESVPAPTLGPAAIPPTSPVTK
jgi:hypothetical protein